jgi:hypothetical protein
MSLSIVVGILAEADDEGADLIRADFAVVRELLGRAGAGQWVEPELDAADTLEGHMWGYNGCRPACEEVTGYALGIGTARNAHREARFR